MLIKLRKKGIFFLKAGLVSHYKVANSPNQECAQLVVGKGQSKSYPWKGSFYLKAEQEKIESFYFFSVSGFSALHDNVGGCNKKLLWKARWTWKIHLSSQEAKLFPQIGEIPTLQEMIAESGGKAVRAQSPSSKISHRESSSFHKNSSSKLFFFSLFISQTHFLSQFPMILQRLLLKPDQA